MSERVNEIRKTDEAGKAENPLAAERVGKLIAKFAIPAIISMLVSSLYNIVDQIFIGQGVGMLGNAATNIAFPISIICTATALMLGIGGASNYNLESGAGNKEKASRIAGAGLSMLVICGTVIAAAVLLFLDPLLKIFGVTPEVLPYAQDYTGITAYGIPFLILTTGGNHLIRADRSPTYSMTCMLTGAILNTILDPLFIFGFHLGIKGAAWATVIGQAVSGALVILYFLRFRKMELSWDMLRPKRSCLRAIASLGMASCINQIAMAAVQITMNNTLRHYGAASMYGTDIPLACVGVISKVNMVFMAICIGISQGCQPIWGFNYGAGRYARVRETYGKAFRLVLAVGITFCLCFQFFPRQLVGIFGTGSEEYFHFAERYFRIFMLMTFTNGIQPMSSGFFTSIGKARLGILVSLTRQVIFLLPLILIFPVFMGIDGVMYAGPIADGAALLAAVICAVRELQKMKALERNQQMKERMPIGFMIKQINTIYEKELNNLLKSVGITASQCAVLDYLFRSDEEAVNQRDIEKALSLRNPTVTGLIKRLEEKGYLLSVPSARDKRCKNIYLTEKAYDIQRRMEANRRKIDKKFTLGMNKKERAALERMLEKVLYNIAEP